MTSYASLASLVAPPTLAQNLAALMAFLELNGFPATAWEPGSAGPAFVNSEAAMFQSLGNTIANIAVGNYLPLPGQPATGAQGPWLDLLGATGLFQTPRNLATFTSGVITLTDAAGAGPFTIQPNACTVEDPSQTYLYGSTNAVPVVLPLNGTLPLGFQAAAQGAAYNLANGGVSKLVTSLAGVTVSNGAIGATGSWITTVGTNKETDALYATRLGAKWGILGSGSNKAAYYYNATTPSVTGCTEVVQCAVMSSGGKVTVVVAGSTGPISAAGLLLVNAAIQAKRPLTVPANVANGIPTLTPFVGNVCVSSLYDPVATLAAVYAAISGVLQTLGLGAKLNVDAIITAVMNVPGVLNLTGTANGSLPSGWNPFTINGQGAGALLTPPSGIYQWTPPASGFAFTTTTQSVN